MAQVVSVYDTSVFGSPDPSGLAYDPITGRLLMVDSEVDEKPFFSTENMYSIGTDGTLDATYQLTQVTIEPTGIAYNTVTGTIFVTDDDTGMIYELDRDDPTVVLNSFSASNFGASDIQDISAAPDGTLYILDRANKTIWHTTADGDLISSVALPSNLKRPEALAYDWREDVFYVSGGWSADIFKVSSDGEILETIKVLRNYRNDSGVHVMPKALVLVPSDDPYGAWTLWVGDYGRDQVQDGRLFEIQLDAPPPPPQPPTVSVLDATPLPQIEGIDNQLAFTFVLSKALAEDVVITFNTVDGTAHAGADYVGVSGGTVTIAAGSTSATAYIDLVNDDVAEGEENFSVAIQSAQQALSGEAVAIAAGGGAATIIDDDPNGPPEVMVYDATVFGSPDPAGLTYVSTRGTLLMVDSEVEEKPFFSSINMFGLHTDGTVSDRIPFTAVSNEPTGVAHWYDADSGRDLLFVTDDDALLVRIVDMDNPLVQIGSFSTTAFGCNDPEDITVDPNTGHLYIVDEASRSIFEVTREGSLVATITLPGTISHPEAIAYDADTDQFYISGFFSSDIFRVSRDGTILAVITVLEDYARADGERVIPKGLELVPDGDGSGGKTLWVADYGVDQVMDGRIFTIHIDPPPPPAVALSDGTPSPQTEAAGAQVTFILSLTQALNDDVVVTVNTVDGSAKAGEDYVALSGVTVTIAAGETSATVTVDLINDTTVEPNETFDLQIASAVLSSDGTAVDIADPTGTATIIDDDSAETPLVTVYDATVFGSPDPSGLTYVSTRGTVILSDSEVDEKPFYSNTNLFELGTDGIFNAGFSLTAFTKEPTGVAHWYDAVGDRDLLFITDDDKRAVYVVDMANPSQLVSTFVTTSFGCQDPEDIAVDPTTGHLIIADESSRKLFEVTQDGTLVSTISLPTIVKHVEAVTYNPEHDTFYVGGFFSADIFEVSRDGALVDIIKVLRDYRNVDGAHVAPKGLAMVPDADGSGYDLWVADYGADQVADGRIFVIDLDHNDNLWV